MKWLLCVVLVLSGILMIYPLLVLSYRFNVEVGQWASLSDDASLPQVKLDYLQKYQAAASSITRNDARYIFKQTQLTRDEQLKILETLENRLQSIVDMDPKSFEYQQAMSQVTGQEYETILDKTQSVFKSCWMRAGGRIIWCWIWFPLGCISILVGIIYIAFLLSDFGY